MQIPDLSLIPELHAVPAGEYRLEIVRAYMKENADKTRLALALGIKIIGEPNALPVNHNLWFASSLDATEKGENMNRRAKAFIDGIGVDSNNSPIPEDFVGITFVAILKASLDFFDQTDCNEIVRIV